MDLATFERRAFELWEQIPAGFRDGVSAFVVEPGVERDADFGDPLYGTCESDPVFLALPDAPVTSIITLYYGSFVEIAAETPDFDWEDELWETIRHELEHHREWVGGEDARGDEDDAQRESLRSKQGLNYQRGFHRWGRRLDPTAFDVEHELFLEVDVPSAQWSSLAQEGLSYRWGDLIASFPPLDGPLPEHGPAYVDADLQIIGDRDVPFESVVLVLYRRSWFWRWFGWLFGR